MAQPNILFIMTDQQRWDALGCSGGWTQTPAHGPAGAGRYPVQPLRDQRPGLRSRAGQPGNRAISP